jgi:hypothetical protein
LADRLNGFPNRRIQDLANSFDRRQIKLVPVAVNLDSLFAWTKFQ